MMQLAHEAQQHQSRNAAAGARVAARAIPLEDQGEESRRMDHSALEDQSEAERGGCDRRGF